MINFRKKTYCIREAHLQLCHWVRLLSQPTTTWSPLHWEFENPPCSFNVAKTNAICESVYSPWTGGSKKQIQFSDLKNDHLWKTNTNALSWESVISSASQSLQIHNITAPPEEMLFRCLERRLNLNLMLGPGLPGYPRKPALLKRCTFTGLSAAVKDALMSTTSSKSAGRETNNSSRDAKTISMNLENMSWKHAFSSVSTSHWEDRGWLAVPSTSVCPHWMLKDCPPPPAKVPVVRHKTCDLASMDSSDIKRLPSWNILLRKLSM